MKAISLWQPWASLCITGNKLVETRSWATSHRGTLLIHAGLKTTHALIELCHEEPFRTALRSIGIKRWQDMPFGVVLGHVQLIECLPTEGYDVDGPERAFGDYTPGRFAWVLCDPVAFATPMPAKGRQQLFDIRPEEIGLQ